MTYNTQAIRELLVAAFSDEEFEAFCHDHFSDVDRQFTTGQTQGARIEILLDHTERRGLMEILLERVQAANAYQYDRFKARLWITQPAETAPKLATALTAYDRPPRATRHRLFGREVELEQVLEALRGRGAVLVHGFGGVGKTALAGAAARQIVEEGVFPGGLVWVAEVGSSPPGAIFDALARGLGDDQIPRLPPVEKAGAARDLLAERSPLLVIDHLADPETARRFLEGALPESAALLATSRQRLLDFEEAIALRIPARPAAMALFRDRAGIEGQDTAVESICDLLDDHPLALVVAAGRVQAEAMSLERLRERLADQQTRLATLRLGSGSGRDRNVWASFQLSYDDLSEAQQRVFTHLAACYGESAGLEFLALVCDLAEEECEDHLGRLVARSLAERQDDRFSLGQLVRDFGREVIEDEVEEVSAQIEEAALTYAQRYAERTPGAFDRLEAELENLLGVAERAGAEEDWNTVVALAQGLEDMLDLRGYWAERVALNEMGLQGARDTGDEISQAWLAHNLALAVQSQGNLEQALELYQESLELNRKQDHPEGVANTLHNMGIIAQDQGELERARELYEQGLEIHQELDNPTGLANSLHQLGRISQDLGELERAQELFEQSLEIEKELRNDAGIAISLHALGQLAQDQEELERARELFEQSLAINRRLGNLSGIAGLLHQLGVMTQDEGDLQQASELYRQSLEIKERLGDLGGIADSLHQLGVIAQEQGDLENARTLMQGSLDIERQMGNLSGIGISLHQFGSLAEAEGNTDEAKEKYREALEIFEHLESPYADLARNDLERLEQGE